MAGSFDVFRKYQRGMLAAVAILAMLAFFVLPPFLQMGSEVGSTDPQVATWSGGGIGEGQMQRAVAMRVVLNQFLRDAKMQAGRDPGDAAVLGEDESDVVRTLLLAREAEANGIVIGNAAVNQFLDQWAERMVRPEQFEALLAGRRMGQTAVSATEVFESLRTVLAAERMWQLAFAGFAGDPPGVRWDIFRRLEQEATVEVVPVDVASLGGEVPAPAEETLRGFFDRFKNALPADRSPDPGFREPHRISYDWVVATRADLEAAAAKDVSDEQITKFYEDNKKVLYVAKPDADASKPDGEAAKDGGDAKTDASQDAKEEAKEPGKDAGGVAGAGFKPLDEVRDEIRKRLAAERVTSTVDDGFRAIAADVSGYLRETVRRAATGEGGTEALPTPDADALAAAHGLAAGHALKRTAGEAVRDGGVGTSFRQAPWTDLMFQMDRQPWNPVETMDAAGNRYLSWKTADMPAFVPEFDAARADVERAWRIVEARPLARKAAEEIAAAASGGRTLADALAGRSGPKLEAATVGPFTWLSRGAAPFGSPVSVSQPEGLALPGEDFMQTVFGLEPGGTAVAFNEPRTVCYAIRLVSYTPAEEELRKRFFDSASDQRRLGAVAERQQARAFEAWLADVEKRANLQWKRPPQRR